MSTNPDTLFRGRAPRRCYANGTEWSGTILQDGETLVEECVEYSHPTYGVVGALSYKYRNGEFVSVEWFSYDPNLAL